MFTSDGFQYPKKTKCRNGFDITWILDVREISRNTVWVYGEIRTTSRRRKGKLARQKIIRERPNPTFPDRSKFRLPIKNVTLNCDRLLCLSGPLGGFPGKPPRQRRLNWGDGPFSEAIPRYLCVTFLLGMLYSNP